MKWFGKLERKFGKYAIRNLMLYMLILYIVGAVIFLYDYRIYFEFLSLDPAKILQGQVWRLVTFLMMPPSTNPFFLILSLYIYWNLGTTIERMWGSFRFNVYFLGGVLGTILATFLIYFIYGPEYSLLYQGVGTTYVNFSLFIAYAFTFPNAQFLLFFLIPIQAKVLGIIEIGAYLLIFLTGDLATKIMIGGSLLNVFVFFLMTRNISRYSPKEIRRRREFKQKVNAVPVRAVRHRCAVCGKTDKDGDDVVFRYCSKCEGNFEYCDEHLYTHIHVTKADLEDMKKKR